MKNQILLYKQNHLLIDNFLTTSLKDFNSKNLDFNISKNYFELTPALSLVYLVTDEFSQSSPYFYKDHIDNTLLGTDKTYLFSKVKFNTNKYYISHPYVNSHTGNLTLTYVKKVDTGYLVLDFNLFNILQQLHLIRDNRIYVVVKKIFYSLIGGSLAIFSLFLILFALGSFAYGLMNSSSQPLDITFKSVISLTLGLAIFDLAKSILDQELFYKHLDNKDSNIFTNFLISIIIALSIEALMVVFKIAMDNHNDMINALYLILGTSTLIISLSIYNYVWKYRLNK